MPRFGDRTRPRRPRPSRRFRSGRPRGAGRRLGPAHGGYDDLYAYATAAPPRHHGRPARGGGRRPPYDRRAFDAADPDRFDDRRRAPDAAGRARAAARERWRRARRLVRGRRRPQRRGPPNGERETWLERGRSFARRARGPIIGVTLAGAAAPLLRPAEAPRDEARPFTGERRPGELPLRPGEAVGEDLARRWADMVEERVRNETIEGAALRYGIGRDLAEDIYDLAVAEGIEPDVAYGLVNTESSFRRRAVSPVGARGLAQLMPRTARELMPGITNEDLFDRRINLRLGFRYLNRLVDKYDGNLRLALLAYNRGPGTVDRVLARGGDPDNGYADRVLRG